MKGLLNIQSWTQEKIQGISLEFEESRKTYQFLKDLASTTGILLSFGSQLSCMVAGIFFVRNNLLTIGLLVASIQLLNGVFAPLQSILYNKNLISSSKSIIDNIQENLYETNQGTSHKTSTIDCDNISTISISQLHYEIENQRLEEGIDKQPFEPIVDNQKEEIVKLFEDKDADFIAFGHNHQLHLYDDNNKTYFNPGSVGLNNGKYAVYGIVTINENEFSVERVKLPYDNEEFLQGFDEKHVPGKQFIFDYFI
ncbi:MAG: metallophosphoesterase family protein [Staphylococcus warneri]|nr:metallophosphoesterase family protein [Staphylococcus warneri]